MLGNEILIEVADREIHYGVVRICTHKNICKSKFKKTRLDKWMIGFHFFFVPIVHSME